MTDRFVVLASDEAKELGVDEDDRPCDNRFGLYDSITSPPTLIAFDGGEPEDQSFHRNWSWVPRRMNAMASELTVLRHTSRELTRSLTEIVRDLLRQHTPRTDHACAQCGAEIPIAGFVCAYHMALDMFPSVCGECGTPYRLACPRCSKVSP